MVHESHMFYSAVFLSLQTNERKGYIEMLNEIDNRFSTDEMGI